MKLVDDIGLPHTAVLREKTLGSFNARVVSGANVVHSGSGGASWAEVRELIAGCQDLPDDVRRQLVALGDESQTARMLG